MEMTPDPFSDFVPILQRVSTARAPFFKDQRFFGQTLAKPTHKVARRHFR